MGRQLSCGGGCQQGHRHGQQTQDRNHPLFLTQIGQWDRPQNPWRWTRPFELDSPPFSFPEFIGSTSNQHRARMFTMSRPLTSRGGSPGIAQSKARWQSSYHHSG